MKKITCTLSVVAALILSGCAVPGVGVNPEKIVNEAQEQGPVTNITKFQDSLRNLGDLIDTYRDAPLYLTVQPIENKTATNDKVPQDITMMVESAINSIGNPKIRLIPYEDYSASPAAFYGQVGNNEFYIIRGAITEFDADIEKSNRGITFGLSGTRKGQDFDGDGTFGTDTSISSVGIDFNIVNAKTLNFVQGVQTKNKMKITKSTNNNDIGFAILGSGVGINGNASQKQGVHSVIRLLVDLSMVEIVGKLRSYPYWVCVHNGGADLDLLNKMKKDFQSYSEEEKIAFVRHLLSIVYSDVSLGTILDEATSKRIIDYKMSKSLIPYNDSITTDLYLSLLINIPKMLTQKEWSKKIDETFYKILG
jgi:hypothetical protein